MAGASLARSGTVRSITLDHGPSFRTAGSSFRTSADLFLPDRTSRSDFLRLPSGASPRVRSGPVGRRRSGPVWGRSVMVGATNPVYRFFRSPKLVLWRNGASSLPHGPTVNCVGLTAVRLYPHTPHSFRKESLFVFVCVCVCVSRVCVCAHMMHSFGFER